MSKEKYSKVDEEKVLPIVKQEVAPVVVVKPQATVVVQTIPFDKYVVRKGVKSSHVAGMRAFAKNVNIKRTFQDWEKFFEKY